MTYSPTVHLVHCPCLGTGSVIFPVDPTILNFDPADDWPDLLFWQSMGSWTDHLRPVRLLLLIWIEDPSEK
jgi:hypothetical protein